MSKEYKYCGTIDKELNETFKDSTKLLHSVMLSLAAHPSCVDGSNGEFIDYASMCEQQIEKNNKVIDRLFKP